MAEKTYTIKIAADVSEANPQIKNLDKILKETGADVLKTSESVDTLGRKIYSVMTSSINAVKEAKKAFKDLGTGVGSFSVTSNPKKELDEQKRAYQNLWKDLLKEQDAALNQQLRKQKELGLDIAKDYKYRELLEREHQRAINFIRKEEEAKAKAATKQKLSLIDTEQTEKDLKRLAQLKITEAINSGNQIKALQLKAAEETRQLAVQTAKARKAEMDKAAEGQSWIKTTGNLNKINERDTLARSQIQTKLSEDIAQQKRFIANEENLAKTVAAAYQKVKEQAIQHNADLAAIEKKAEKEREARAKQNLLNLEATVALAKSKRAQEIADAHAINDKLDSLAKSAEEARKARAKQNELNLRATVAAAKARRAQDLADAHAYNDKLDALARKAEQDRAARARQNLANLEALVSQAKARRKEQERLGADMAADIKFANSVSAAHDKAIKENKKRIDKIANDNLRAQQALGQSIVKDLAYQELLDREHFRARKMYDKELAALKKEANAKMLFDAHNLNAKFDAAQKAANARAKELEQVRLSQFSQFLKDREALLRADIQTQRQVEISGMNSIEAHRARANQQRLAAEQAYRNRIAIIESSVKGGTSSSVGQTQATAAMTAYLAALKLVDAQLAVHEKAVQKTETVHKAMWLRVVEVTAVYRLWTAAIQHGQQALMSVPTTGIHYEGAKAGLQAITGSTAGASREMAFLNHEAKRTGLALDGLRSSFRLFAASAITAGESMETVESIFANVNTMATTLHLSTYDVNGIFLALGQTFNKGKLQAEELVKQLAQRVPGSVNLMAKAYAKAGETVQHATERLLKDMKMGNVAAHDNIKKLGEEMAKMFGGEAFVHASSGLNAAIGRLDTSWTHLTENVYKSTSGVMMAVLNSVTAQVEGLGNLLANTQRVEQGFSSFGSTVSNIFTGLGALVGGVMTAWLGTAIVAWAQLAGRIGIVASAALGMRTGLTLLWGVMLENPLTSMAAGLTAAAVAFSAWNDQEERRNKNSQEAAKVNEDWLREKAFPKTEAEKFSFSVDKTERVSAAKQLRDNAEQDLKKFEEKVKEGTWIPDGELGLNPFTLRKKIEETLRVYRTTLKDRNEAYVRIYNEEAESLKKQANLGNVNDQSTLEETQYDLSSRKNEKEIRKLDQRISTLNKQKQLDIDTLTASAKMQEDRTGKIADSGKLEQSILAVSKKYHEQINELLRKKSRLTEEGEQKTLSAAGKSITAFEKLVVIMRTMESSSKRGEDRPREDAVSPVGAVGRHQVMPSTLAHGNYGDRVQGIPDAELQKAISFEHRRQTPQMTAYLRAFALKYSEQIAAFGVNELKRNFEHFGGDASKALAAYNAGRGAVESAVKRAGENWLSVIRSGNPEARKQVVDYVREGIRLGAPKAAGELDKYEGQRSTIQAQMEDQGILAKKEALTAESIAATREKALRLEKEKTAEQQIKNTLVNEELQLTIDTFTQNQLALDLAKITLDANKKEAEFAKDKNFAGIELLKIQTTQARVQATLADAERKVARDSEFASIRENELSLRKLSGMVTEKQYLEELQKIKESQLPGLQTQLDLTASITKEEDRQLAILRIKEQMRAIREPNRGAAGQFLKQAATESDITGYIAYQEKENTFKTEKEQGLTNVPLPLTVLPSGELQTYETYLQQKNEIETKYNDASLVNNMKYFSGLANMGASTFQGLTSQMIQMYGAHSKEARRAFILQKALAIGNAIINTALSVTNIMKTIDPPANFVLAGLAGAIGAVQIATIVAQPMPQAHGGLEYVPEDATYKLSKGERVLAPRQNEAFMKLNRDLSAQMQRNPQGIGSPSPSPKPTIVKPRIKVVNVDYSSQELSSLLQSSAGEEIVVNHMIRNKEALA